MDIVSALARARDVIEIEIDAMKCVGDALDESFHQATQLILTQVNAGHKVVVTGMGKSMHVGQKMAATLTSTGTPSVTLHPAEAMHGDLGLITDGDVVIVLSYSGESDEVITLLPLIKRMGNSVIALTANSDSTLAKNSDVMISIAVPREACPFNMAPTASTTATLAVGDALALVLLEARGFKKEDYARFHPGGAIGRSLLLKISEVMRSGDRVATVTPDARVQEAVIAMTRAKSGAVAVVSPDHEVLGVFTDGDLRRHMQDLEGLTTRLISDVMTADPITVQETALAAEVLDHLRIFPN